VANGGLLMLCLPMILLIIVSVEMEGICDYVVSCSFDPSRSDLGVAVEFVRRYLDFVGAYFKQETCSLLVFVEDPEWHDMSTSQAAYADDEKALPGG